MTRSLLVSPALLYLCACATVTTVLGGTLTVEDAELAGLSAEQKATLDPAQAAEAAALGELTARQAALGDAEREVDIASWGVRQAEAGLEIARLRFEQAQETKNADAMLPARQAREAATRALERAEAEHAFRVAARAHQEAVVEQAEAARDVAAAALQLERLNAVLAAKQGGPTPEDEERRATFEKQLAGRKATLADEAVAVAEAKAARDEAERARQARAQAPGTAAESAAATATPAPAAEKRE